MVYHIELSPWKNRQYHQESLQLQNETKHGDLLKDKNILYAPDYVINAGGLINVYHELRGYDEVAAKAQATGIYETLRRIFAVLLLSLSAKMLWRAFQ